MSRSSVLAVYEYLTSMAPCRRSLIISLVFQTLGMCLPCKEAGHGHDIPGVGIFSNHAFYSFQGSELPDGLYPNTDRVGGAHFERIYESDLVSVSDGYLNLLVPGGQVSGPIRGSGVNTKANNILYASVRTQAAFSHVPGTIQSR